MTGAWILENDPEPDYRQCQGCGAPLLTEEEYCADCLEHADWNDDPRIQEAMENDK